MSRYPSGLRPGSFRGVRFVAVARDDERGRRLDVAEFALSEQGRVTDLGRRWPRYTLTAFTNGKIGDAAGVALIAAAEKPGAGELIHPWLGRMQVHCETCRVHGEIAELGMTRFDLVFIAATGATLAAEIDTASAVARAADAAIAAAQGSFGTRFDVSAADWLSADAWSDLNRLADRVAAIRVPSLTGLMDAARREFVSQAPGQLTGAIRLASSVANLVGLGLRSFYSGYSYLAARGPLGSIFDLIAGGETSRALSSVGTLFGRAAGPAAPLIASAAPDRSAAGDRLSRLRSAAASIDAFTTGRDPVPATTATRAIQAQNRAATDLLVGTVTVAEMARVGSAVSFESYDQAQAWRAELVARIQAALLIAPDEMLDPLTDLRRTIQDDIDARAGSLPRLASFTTPTTLPALVVAWRIYGDADRAGELIDRNQIEHGSFVPGGQALEVLVDA